MIERKYIENHCICVGNRVQLMPDRPMTTDGHNAKRACVRVCLYVEYIHTYMYMKMCACVCWDKAMRRTWY